MHIAIALPALCLALAASEPLPLISTIQKVRLHTAEAWVTRSGKISIPSPGTHFILIGGLPEKLALEDLRIQALGPEGTTLGEVRVAPEPERPLNTPESKLLKERLESLYRQREQLDIQQSATERTTEVILSALKPERSDSGRSVSPQSVIELSRQLEVRLVEMGVQSAQRAKELERLKEKIQEEESNWKALLVREGRHQATSRAIVELLVPKAGEVRFEITTRTLNARWKPSYEIRITPEGKAEMLLYAAVSQASGESWQGVALELSTAETGAPRQIPTFRNPFKVGWTAPAPVFPVGRGVMPGATVEVVANATSVDSTSVSTSTIFSTERLRSGIPTVADIPRPVLEPAAPIAGYADGLFSVFPLEGVKDIPPDGEPRRFKLFTSSQVTKQAVVVAPRLSDQAYQIARFELPTNLPLFPGSPVFQFFGNQRLGEVPLVLPPAGHPLEVNLGPFRGLRSRLVQERVVNPYQKVEYTQVRQAQHGAIRETVKSEVKTIGEGRTWILTERFILSNDTSNPLTVELRDRLVGSNHQSVKVQLSPDSTPGSVALSDLGHRAWTIVLEGRKATEIRQILEIMAPKDGSVNGLRELGLE
ncbi:MAG: mucoidy inhibitor MuiA family protein [Holophaga sp.]|nr:mucoidy inhibitor MuiA family protein [Holophaga sp.]